MRNLFSAAVLAAAVLCGTAASATDLGYRYSQPGQSNMQNYSFTATADGPLTVYTMNSTGYYLSTLGVKVNGTTVANGILPSGSPIFVGTNLGTLHQGDEVEFFINVYDRDDAGTFLGTYYSDQSDNADGLNHLFADYHPDEWWIGVHEGVFFGFEDTTTGDNRGDKNYNDYTFVVPGLTIGAPILHHPGGDNDSAPSVPEPASWAMMVMGFGIAGTAMRRRRPIGAYV
jgi:hypothetical protein